MKSFNETILAHEGLGNTLGSGLAGAPLICVRPVTGAGRGSSPCVHANAEYLGMLTFRWAGVRCDQSHFYGMDSLLGAFDCLQTSPAAVDGTF